MAGLTFVKHADKSEGRREIRYTPDGIRTMVNPDTEGDEHEPWPLAGVTLDEALPTAEVSTGFVAKAIAEGWAELEGEDVVHRPGGPLNNRWAVTHTMVQADAIVFHLMDGDVRYRVVHQPDKYVESGTDSTKMTDQKYADGDSRVDFFYGLKLDKGGK